MNSGLCRPGKPQSKTERKRKERKLPRPRQRTKQTMKHEGDCDTNCNQCAQYSHQRIDRRDWMIWK